MKTTAEKIEALRAQIEGEGVDGYLIPKADEFQGEFVAPYAERLFWLTEFSGSAGIAVVMKDKAAVLTDGRYTIQVVQQVDGDVFETGDSITTGVHGWLIEQGDGDANIGYDPWLFTPAQLKKIQEECPDLTLTPIDENLIDRIWSDQPQKPVGEISVFNESLAGKTLGEKRACISKVISKQGADHTVLTLPDSIAWLLNIRGQDTPYIPGVQAYAIVSANEDTPIKLFVDADKVSGDAKSHFKNDVEILPVDKLAGELQSLNGTIMLDDKRSPQWFENTLKKNDVKIIHAKDPCIDIRAVKTEREKAAIREAHGIDGIALVKFLFWIDQNQNADLTEISVTEKLFELRSQHPAFKQNSFPTIAGFGANGAIVHYRASKKTDAKIGQGLLLIDSGGQYYDGDKIAGTTDITRTITIGEPTQEMRENFTHVLKGHIVLASAIVSKDTTGKEVDAIARKPLHEAGIDFAHGTGHGVGCYLAVHEEATNISSKVTEAFKAGMLLSNEPGYYKEGEYGIRIENLIFVQSHNDESYGFETISFAPIDLRLVEERLLNEEEKHWLNTYHHKTFEKLKPYLNSEEVAWLESQTRRI